MEPHLHFPICLYGVVLNYTEGQLFTFGILLVLVVCNIICHYLCSIYIVVVLGMILVSELCKAHEGSVDGNDATEGQGREI